MSSEATKLDTESAAIVKEAEAHNANLEAGADGVVATGAELEPVAKPDNPMDARKAIYKKASAKRREQAKVVSDENPSVEHMEQLRIEQLEAEEAARAQEAQPKGEAVEQPAVIDEKKAEPEPVLDPAARVMITVNGAQLDVTQGDIDNAGGVAELQKSLSADQRFRDAANLKREAEQRIVEAKAAEASLREAQTAKAALDLPKPDDQGNEDQDASAKAKAAVKAFFEGDADAAEAALAEAFKSQRVAAPVQEVKLPEATVTPQQTVPQLQFGQRYVSPEEKGDIDTLMNSEFGQVMKSQTLTGTAHDRFSRLMADPANQSRRSVDIAREAATWAINAESPPTDPLADRRALKRSTPQSPTTTQRHTAPEPPAAQTKADIVNNMRKARGQDPR